MLINIQFLRFAAAFLVVLYHGNTHVVATGAAQGPIFAIGEAVGFAGVDVFFVISGFIMFYTTDGKNGVAACSVFLRRRLARIYSGYWPFLAMAALVFWWARPTQFSSADMIGSIFLLPVPMNLLLLDISWTLTFELYFYVLFTVLILVSSGLRWWLMTSALFIFLIYNLVRQVVWNDFSEENLHANSFANLFYLSPFLMQFFAGAVLARFSKCGSQSWAYILLLL
jgi:exopolysaccharide production protein ExoZ